MGGACCTHTSGGSRLLRFEGRSDDVAISVFSLAREMPGLVHCITGLLCRGALESNRLLCCAVDCLAADAGDNVLMRVGQSLLHGHLQRVLPTAYRSHMPARCMVGPQSCSRKASLFSACTTGLRCYLTGVLLWDAAGCFAMQPDLWVCVLWGWGLCGACCTHT